MSTGAWAPINQNIIAATAKTMAVLLPDAGAPPPPCPCAAGAGAWHRLAAAGGAADSFGAGGAE